MSPPLEPGPIYAPGAGPPHPALQRRQAERARREEAARAAAAAWTAPPAPAPPVAAPPPMPLEPAPVPVSAPAPVEYQAQPVARPVAEKRRFDWVIGVVLGIVLGLGVAAAFVFIGSEDTVDAPQVRGDVPAKTTGPGPNGQTDPEGVLEE